MVLTMTSDDSYSRARPDRFEQFLARTSVRSVDVEDGHGGSSGIPATSQCEVAAELAGLHIHEVSRLISQRHAIEAADHLLRFKYHGDQSSRSHVYSAGMWMAISLAIANKWSLEPRGCLDRCVRVAIDDIASPRPFDLSSRSWAHLLGLDNHMQWYRIWRVRYRDVRHYLQALELAAIDHIRRPTYRN